MARSHAVWLVTRNNEPFMAFTVKHELMSFLETRPYGWNFWSVYRLPDGDYRYDDSPEAGKQRVRKYDVYELLGKKVG